MIRLVLIWFGVFGFASAMLTAIRADEPAPPPPPAPSSEQVEFFETKVRPILSNKCMGCHGPEKHKANLRVDSAGGMRTGGDSGPAIVPGDPDQSPLIAAVRYQGDVQMPPKGKLADAEIAALADWVKQGAPWPISKVATRPGSVAAVASISEEDRAFWSFQPVRDPVAPLVRDAGWPVTTIDRFILAKLEANGLSPAPSANKATLIRRATFDLIGLPPTPDDIEAFLYDDSSDAFKKVVDRLLASPSYGERWGRHWLDIARYGEDQAHSFQPRLYPNGYRYRDWVVAAINADMPYDQFLRDQIAGDLVDEPGRSKRLPALGFFACGPVYYGDPKKFDQIDDRIDTMSRGFLGLTVSCARCHDHKFDPIPTADYYALAGVFASSEYEESPLASAEDVSAYAESHRPINAKEQEIEALFNDARAKRIGRTLTAVWKVSALGNQDRKKTIDEIAKQTSLDPSLLKRWVGYLDPGAEKGRNRALFNVWFNMISYRRPAFELIDDEASLLEVEQVSYAIEGRIQALLSRVKQSPPDSAILGPGKAKTGVALKSKLDAADRAVFADLFGPKGVVASPKERIEPMLTEVSKSQLEGLRRDLEKLKKAAPVMYPVAHALKESDTPKNLNVLIRGNPNTPGPEAPRRFLSILGGASFHKGSGRLELAQAVASPENPLTARVMVNRIWQHHFGVGLVGTSSNFGEMGERPTHPELLDHLATRFVADGWSLKKMHRMIMLSATYQQSSRAAAKASAGAVADTVDPENRLLWRMNRRRLEVEAWRDAMLAVSGRLDLSIGGPPSKLDAANQRRTLYANVSRHDLAPMLRLLDFPDPNITSASRTKTTVPLQQLLVLNGEFTIKSARALATRLQATAGDASRVKEAYRLLFGRLPSDREVQIGLAYLSAPDPAGVPSARLSRWERYAQALLASNEFLFVD